jgi:hypothetical protein
VWAELMLIVAATAGFAIWQWRDLAHEKRRNAEARARRGAAQMQAGQAAPTPADTPPARSNEDSPG